VVVLNIIIIAFLAHVVSRRRSLYAIFQTNSKGFISVVFPDLSDDTRCKDRLEMSCIQQGIDLEEVSLPNIIRDTFHLHKRSLLERKRDILLISLERSLVLSCHYVAILLRDDLVLSYNFGKKVEALCKARSSSRNICVLGNECLLCKHSYLSNLKMILELLPPLLEDTEWILGFCSLVIFEGSESFFSGFCSPSEVSGRKEEISSSVQASRELLPPGNIPLTLFGTGPWPRSALPEKLKLIFKAFENLNPGFRHVYLDDDDSDTFVSRNFSMIYPFYENLIPGAYRADVLRLCLLLTHGGFYSDVGQIHLVPMREICQLEVAELFLVAEPTEYNGIYNSFMAAPRGHSLIAKFLDAVIENISEKRYGIDFLDITGPKCLGRVFHRETNILPEATTPSGLQVTKEGTTVYLLRNRFTEQRFGGTNAIVDEKKDAERILIEPKFPEYFEECYAKRGKMHYHEAWFRGSVYKDHTLLNTRRFPKAEAP